MNQTIPKLLSRSMLLAWCFWLMISWLINVIIDGPEYFSNDAMLPVVRGMLISVMVGIGLIWPTARLTQAPFEHIKLRLFSDIIALTFLFQLVLWLMHVQVNWGITGDGPNWSQQQTLFLGLIVLCWTLPVSLFIYIGNHQAPLPRIITLLCCYFCVVGGIAIATLGGPFEAAQWSPFTAVWQFSDPLNRFNTSPMAQHVLIVTTISVVGWIIALVTRWFFKRDSSTITMQDESPTSRSNVT